MSRTTRLPQSRAGDGIARSREPVPPWSRLWLHPLVQIMLARTLEFFREPEAIFWVYGFPILMTVALGLAFRDRPVEIVAVAVVEGPAASPVAAALEPLPVAVGAPSPSASSPARLPDATGAEGDRFKVAVVGLEEGRRLLRTGRVSVLVSGVPRRGTPAGLDGLELELRYDPTRPEALLARRAIVERLQRTAGRVDPLTARDLHVTEPGGRYIDFLIPGLIGASLMGGGLWGIGFAVVDLRVRNLLKRLLTTPMRKAHFLAGLILSRFLFMVPEVLVILVFARAMFGVRVYGSWLLTLGLIALGAAAFAGIGLLVACRAKTVETASGLMNLVMLPMYVLSGIFFSSERFPEAMQPVIRLLPLTSLIDALRSVMLEASGLASLGWELANLLVWTVASFALALKWFRWI